MVQAMALSADDINPTDQKILDMLHEGRVTAAYVADETGYSTGNVRNRLHRLLEHDHVRKVYDGLFELVDDPRE